MIYGKARKSMVGLKIEKVKEAIIDFAKKVKDVGGIGEKAIS